MSKRTSIPQFMNRFAIYFTLLVIFGILLINSTQQYLLYKKTSNETRQEKLNNATNKMRNLVQLELKEVEESRHLLIQTQTNLVKANVDRLSRLVEMYVSNHPTLPELTTLERVYRGTDVYNEYTPNASISFFSLDGVCLYSENEPENVGQNMIHVKDSLGNYAIANELKELEGKNSACIISQGRTDTDKHRTKITYIRRIEGLNCYAKGVSYSDTFYPQILDYLGEVRHLEQYSYSGYIFIVEGNGKVIRGEVNQMRNNTNLLQANDTILNNAFQKLVKAAKEKPEGQFVNYTYYKNSNDLEVTQKIAYVCYYAPCDWIIGAGLYTNEVNKELDIIIESFRQKAITNIQMLVLFLLIVICLEIFFLRRFNKHLSSDFKILNNLFISENVIEQRLNTKLLWFDETQDMGKYVNTMNMNLDAAFKRLQIEQLKSAESDRLKSAFLANLSHEVRTPMNAIVGLSSMLSDELDEETRSELINLINISSDQLLNLIEDVVEISRLENASSQIILKKVAMKEIFDEVNSYYISESERQDKNLEYISENTLGDDFYFMGDPKSIIRVSKLLINNAIKFTHKGNICFRVELTEKGLLFIIRDTGIGIAPKSILVIFNHFTQAYESENNQLARSYRGVGIGLALSKQLVHLMQGKIWVESTLHEGSSFQFLIPYVEAYEKDE